MSTGTDPKKWLQDHLPHCMSLSTTPTTTDYVNCFKDIENISCNDIKSLISQVKDSGDEQQFVKVAKFFNDNKDVIEEGANAVSHTLNNVKCMLREVNNQILTGKDDQKFDLKEVDQIRDTVITNIGGITQSQHHRTLIGATVIISILVIILFFVLIFGRK